MSTDAILACHGVTRRFGATVALDALDFTLPPRGVTALLGANGAGKSTLIALALGRLRPDAGTVQLFGRPPRDVAARARVGAMLQAPALPSLLTVREQVALFAGYYAAPRPIDEAIALAGLDALSHRRCRALSGGEQRRVLFALAIVGRPDLLVLDEPTAGLDADGRVALWATVRSLVAAGTSVLLTTHHLDEADALADRVVVLDHGRIVADDTSAAVKALVRTRSIRCRTALDPTAIVAMPGVRDARRVGAVTEIRSAGGEATLRALLASDPGLEDLTVQGASLEDAVALLTARPASAGRAA
jgi:ABC-2 type transport system ATP-binding protein